MMWNHIGAHSVEGANGRRDVMGACHFCNVFEGFDSHAVHKWAISLMEKHNIGNVENAKSVLAWSTVFRPKEYSYFNYSELNQFGLRGTTDETAPPVFTICLYIDHSKECSCKKLKSIP